MAMWKKIGIAVLVLVLLAGAATGIYFGVTAAQEAKEPKGIHYTMDYMEDEYVIGDKMVLRITAQDDVAFTSMKYTIDSGEDESLTVTTGETAENTKLDEKDGKYFIDTGIEVINTTGMKAGTHVVQIYVVQDTTQILLVEKVFKLTEAA